MWNVTQIDAIINVIIYVCYFMNDIFEEEESPLSALRVGK